jgi:hypothetical protein
MNTVFEQINRPEIRRFFFRILKKATAVCKIYKVFDVILRQHLYSFIFWRMDPLLSSDSVNRGRC